MSLDSMLWRIRPRSGKLSWVDPASFAAKESDTHLLYFTKLSGKPQDFYFLLGIHLNVLCSLNDQGFQTWISRAYDLATMYQIDMNSCTDLSSSQF